jgi:hypothetical protein
MHIGADDSNIESSVIWPKKQALEVRDGRMESTHVLHRLFTSFTKAFDVLDEKIVAT